MNSADRSAHQTILRIGHHLSHVLAVGAIVTVLVPSGTSRAGQTQQPTLSKAAVREATTPKVLTIDLRQLARVKVYTEGQPVHVIEDLREDGRIPNEGKTPARALVAPQVQRRVLSNAPKVEPYKPGDPIHVVGDSKRFLGAVPTTSAVPMTAARSGPTGGAAPPAGTSALPTFIIGFDGIPATGFLPPDTNGAVGPSHYIQMVNTAFAIFDKQGNLLAGPALINVLWAGFGGPCANMNSGDPVARYDRLADRWLISQFALPGGAAGFHECIAISRTADPVAGGWFLYDFPTVDTVSGQPVFPDYPKIAVWPDAYYGSTQRGFPNGGLDVWAFERDRMLTGAPARAVQFAVGAPSIVLLPSDLDGPPPPAGTPNFYVRQVDGARFGGAHRLEVFAFSVNWANPAASTFNLVATLPTTPFNSVLCQATLMGTCVPQPGTAQMLETLTVWPMWRAAYRNFGTHETLLTNHTINVGQNQAAIRWYELRRPPGGAWGIVQEGTHAPDGAHRWMGSLAMDSAGDIALGYSVSSGAVFPSIRVAGRLGSDPLGTLGGEVNLMAGGGSQTHPSSRWGNYSSMDVDPTDDCTFWHTSEYYSATSVAGWRTRISSFKYPSCAEGSPRARYMYSAKLICGLQRDPKNMTLTRGFYATAINIHNPSREAADFFKKLALTHPPEDQKPGKIIPIANDYLGPDQALEVDCMDIQGKLFPEGFPTPFIKGFVVVESTQSLDVTAVYTVAALDKNGNPDEQSGIEVEQIHERKLAVKPAPQPLPRPGPPPPPPAANPIEVFSCRETCPDLDHCYGIDILTAERQFCFNQDATDTLVSIPPGALGVTPSTGATKVFRCNQTCPDLGICYGLGELTALPQLCFNQDATYTGINVAPGNSLPASSPGTIPVLECTQLCPDLDACYGRGVLTTFGTSCAYGQSRDTGLRAH